MIAPSIASPRKLLLLVFLARAVFPAFAGSTELSAPLLNSLAPEGDGVQLQVFLDTPQALTSGSALVQLDPAIFGTITFAMVYITTGDQASSTNIQGTSVDLEFSSQTGGIGRVLGLLLFTITAPILANAAIGASYVMSIQPGATSWMDTQGVAYSVKMSSGAFTVGGDLSVNAVDIADGLQPGSTMLEIDGNGFGDTTDVAIDGVAIGQTQAVSPRKILVTLAQPAIMDFRRVTA